jgi:hypothetical protein
LIAARREHGEAEEEGEKPTVFHGESNLIGRVGKHLNKI